MCLVLEIPLLGLSGCKSMKTPETSSCESVVTDVCVYGGVSGGVTAAIQAARMGKSVVLISQTKHLGGMTTSGLGWTDFGNDKVLGGLSREFYHRVYLHYRQNAAWIWEKKEDFKNVGQGAEAFIGSRMVSDYVMTEHNCLSQIMAEDSIGLGAYTMDSHHTQRYVSEEGGVRNEGDIQHHIPKPYSIAYRAIVPKKTECTNLLVPWALSASHMAFGSIRMEPVFMTLGQSAATAACIAIDAGTTVQEVPYSRLKARLLADGQIL
jgi:hypothetical protein